jgi:hypothetical protein
MRLRGDYRSAAEAFFRRMLIHYPCSRVCPKDRAGESLRQDQHSTTGCLSRVAAVLLGASPMTKGSIVMLSLETPITAHDIQEITALGDNGNVFLLHGHGADSIVIKYENMEAGQIKSARPAIKAISPSTKLKFLKTDEIQALNSFVADFQRTAQGFAEAGMPLDKKDLALIKGLKSKLDYSQGIGRPKNIDAAQRPWYKMALVNVTDLHGVLEQSIEGDKSDLKAFIATLNAKDGLEGLGRILAVDLYIMNSDRFWPQAGTQQQLGGITFEFRCLRNLKNVFRIETDNGGSEVGAMDFIFHADGYTDVHKPLAECERSKPWGGRTLASKALREFYAKDVAHDLELVFNPRRGNHGLKTKLKSDAASRISAGMVSGAQLIWGKQQMKYHPNGWTAGTSDRQAILAKVEV